MGKPKYEQFDVEKSVENYVPGSESSASGDLAQVSRLRSRNWLQLILVTLFTFLLWMIVFSFIGFMPTVTYTFYRTTTTTTTDAVATSGPAAVSTTETEIPQDADNISTAYVGELAVGVAIVEVKENDVEATAVVVETVQAAAVYPIPPQEEVANYSTNEEANAITPLDPLVPEQPVESSHAADAAAAPPAAPNEEPTTLNQQEFLSESSAPKAQAPQDNVAEFLVPQTPKEQIAGESAIQAQVPVGPMEQSAAQAQVPYIQAGKAAAPQAEFPSVEAVPASQAPQAEAVEYPVPYVQIPPANKAPDSAAPQSQVPPAESVLSFPVYGDDTSVETEEDEDEDSALIPYDTNATRKNEVLSPPATASNKYYLSNADEELPWFDALATCQAYGMQLVSIPTEEKQAEINAYLEEQKVTLADMIWTSGITTDMDKNGQYAWAVTGDKVNYTNWLPTNTFGEPMTEEQPGCVAMELMDPAMPGLFVWKNAPCAEAHRFLCESY